MKNYENMILLMKLLWECYDYLYDFLCAQIYDWIMKNEKVFLNDNLIMFCEFSMPQFMIKLKQIYKTFLIKNSCESWTFDDLYDLLKLETYDPIYEK